MKSQADSQKHEDKEAEKEEKQRKRAEKYLSQVKRGEEVLLLGEFSGMRTFIVCFVAIIALVLVNRFLTGSRMFLALLVNILVVLAAFQASSALAEAHNSVIVVTNRRVFGVAGMNEFDLRYNQIQKVGVSQYLFLDTGNAQTSVRIRYMTNARDFYNTIIQYVREDGSSG